jgi:hypothetical protein
VYTPVFTIDRLWHFSIIYSLFCLVFNFQVRWVVKAANARIKRWKYFANILPSCSPRNGKSFMSSVISHLADFRSRLLSSTKLLRELISFERNFILAARISSSSAEWTKKRSPSYIHEYLDGESQILIHKEDPGLIRVKIHSRHISSKQYILWIQFTESTISAWSSTNSPQFLTPYNCFSLCLANPRYHSTDAIWEQTPTTRAPARHLQYHALIVDSVNISV